MRSHKLNAGAWSTAWLSGYRKSAARVNAGPFPHRLHHELWGGSRGIEVEPAIEEELVRNFNITNLMLSSFKDIAAVSDSPAVYTEPFRMRLTSPVIGGFLGLNGPNLLSIATPSLLFDDLSLQRPSGEVPNLPFSRHPSFDK